MSCANAPNVLEVNRRDVRMSRIDARERSLIVLLLLLLSVDSAAESVCFGTTSNGRLEGGARLPAKGPNFVSYGTVPEVAGRTYVHSKVKDVIVEAYRLLEQELPEKVFKYAETGFKEGGQFKPHKTHRNGLSVDFIVPVNDKSGKSVHLPTNPLNKYGYGIEFNAKSQFDEYTIDYEALAAHIVALHKAALKYEVGIWRVIFDPTLTANLYSTKNGMYIKNNIEIPSKASWVRHDEHYHVDFQIECKPIAR